MPAPVCTTRYINGGKYQSGDVPSEISRLLKERLNNIAFYQTTSLNRPVESESHLLLVVSAIKNVELDEGLYVDYDSAFDFAGRQCRCVR